MDIRLSKVKYKSSRLLDNIFFYTLWVYYIHMEYYWL